MRGKVSDASGRFLTYRITPAYAGKSDRVKHCGSMLMGSPPPMRGKGCTSCRAILEVGITPAYAGKSEALASNPDAQEDHPRLCGEKRMTDRPFTEKQGSPPPMRGKVTESNLLTRENRITPAYAGKSCMRAERTPVW